MQNTRDHYDFVVLTFRKLCVVHTVFTSFTSSRLLYPPNLSTMTMIFDIAKSAAGKNVHHLSGIPAPTVPRPDIGNIGTWFDATSVQAHRVGTLSNLALSLQSMTNVNGRITLMTHPTSDHIPTVAHEVIAFSLGDTFTHFNLNYTTRRNATRYVVSVLPSGLADSAGFTRVPQDMNTLAPLAGGAGGLDRFLLPDYNPTVADTAPVLVYVPVLCMLSYGHGVTNSTALTGLDLGNEPYPADGTTAAWITAMQWLVANNNSDSLHHQSTLFDTNALPLHNAGFPQADDMATTCNMGDHIIPLRDDGTMNYGAIMHRIHNSVCNACQQGGIHATTGIPLGGGTNEGTVIKTISSTEAERTTAMEETIAKYSTFLIGYSTGSDELSLPPISESFQRVLKQSTSTKTYKESVDNFNDFMWQASRQLLGPYSGATTMNGEFITPYMAYCLRDFEWSTKTLEHHPESVNRKLSIFAFCTPEPGTVEFKSTIVQGQEILRQSTLAHDKSKVDTPKGELYTQGLCSLREHAKAAIANVMAMLLFIHGAPANHEPVVIRGLKDYFDRLDNMEYKRTVDSITSGSSPNIYWVTNYLADTTKILQLVASFTLSLAPSVAKDDPAALTTAFQQTLRNLRSLSDELDAEFSRGSFVQYATQPKIWSYLGHAKQPDTKPAATGQQGTTESPERKKQKKGTKNTSPTSVTTTPTATTPTATTPTTTTPTASSRGNTTKGILKKVGEHNQLPSPPGQIRAMNMFQGGTLTRLCRTQLLDGQACPNNPCNYAHVTVFNFNDRIPDVEHQKAFCKYVTDSDKFTWAGRELKPKDQSS